MLSPIDVARRQLTLSTDRIHSLPVVVLMAHSRCNCRCVMCDIWRANKTRRELTAEDLEPHLEPLRRWRVRRVVLSGGEALMHSNLWALCERLRSIDASITLLSTGMTLGRHAAEVARFCDEVIVSLDGPPAVHDEIRGVPRAFERLAEGVAAVRDAALRDAALRDAALRDAALRDADADVAAGLRVTARSVVQRRNFRHLEETLDAARDIGLDAVSLLAADVSSEAFNRPGGWPADRVREVGLERDEARELEALIERLIERRGDDLRSGFLVESAGKLRRIGRYFRALAGDGEPPTTSCNAPWVSTVVEADGAVRPCFFHPPFGNLRRRPLADILNSSAAVAFRRRLDVERDPICRRCVCSLHLAPHQAP